MWLPFESKLWTLLGVRRICERAEQISFQVIETPLGEDSSFRKRKQDVVTLWQYSVVGKVQLWRRQVSFLEFIHTCLFSQWKMTSPGNTWLKPHSQKEGICITRVGWFGRVRWRLCYGFWELKMVGGGPKGKWWLGFPPGKWLGLLTAWQQASKRERPTCESRSFRCLKTQPQELHGGTSTTVYGSRNSQNHYFPIRSPSIFLTRKVYSLSLPWPTIPAFAQQSLPSAVRFR